MSNEEQAGGSSTPSFVQTTGWSAINLKVGKTGEIEMGSVNIYDAAGSQQFREFMAERSARRKRQRRDPRETRYLPELENGDVPGMLSDEAKDYLADMRRRNLSESSLENMEFHFRMLKLATGDVTVNRITAKHIQKFWDNLRWWPARVGSNKKMYGGKTDAEILEIGRKSNRAPRADATMDLAVQQVSTFFNGLVTRGVISRSPVAAFNKPKRSLVSKAKPRRAFTTEELLAIFESKKFEKWRAKAPHNWWAPMIGLYTGARVAEVAQLKVSDVAENCGVLCIHIQVTEDADGEVRQGAKGKSSIRVVPIAQPLLDAGFLDFLDDAKAGGHPRLFPQLKHRVNKQTGKLTKSTYGAMLSRLFSAQLKRHLQIEKGLAFHCFRHYFITSLTLSGVEIEDIACVTGHSVNEGLGSRQGFRVIREYYTHIPDEVLRTKQIATLSSFAPPVSLPRYVRGQFAHCFGPRAKRHP